MPKGQGYPTGMGGVNASRRTSPGGSTMPARKGSVKQATAAQSARTKTRKFRKK